MAYAPDPGAVFASDTHRRTLGHLPLGDPIALELLVARMDPDAHTDLDTTSALEVLEDLEADGHAGKTKAGWKMTKSGLGALTGENG